VAKQCEIGPKLQLITNIKSFIGFQVTCKSLTLDDLKGRYARFQRKTGHISETVRDRCKVTINHQKEVAYALSD